MMTLGQRHQDFHLWQMIQKQMAENPQLFYNHGDVNRLDTTTSTTTQRPTSTDAQDVRKDGYPSYRRHEQSKDKQKPKELKSSPPDGVFYDRRPYNSNDYDFYDRYKHDDIMTSKDVVSYKHDDVMTSKDGVSYKHDDIMTSKDGVSYKPYSQNAVNEHSYGHLATPSRRNRYADVEKDGHRVGSRTYIVEPMK